MARPTKYKPEFSVQILSLAAAGHTKAEICANFGICRDTLYQWKNDPDKPEFSDAYKRAEVLIEAWFISRFKEIATSGAPPGAVAALIWLSKNCLKWGQSNAESEGNHRRQITVVRIDSNVDQSKHNVT